MIELPRPVLNKPDMYRRLAAGEFGNTLPQWFDAATWERESDPSLPLWGIRSAQVGGDRRMRLNVPRAEVADLFNAWFPNGGNGNISPMIDMYAVLRAEVIDTQFGGQPGLNMFYVPPPGPGSPTVIDPADPWRGAFRNYGRTCYRAEAAAILRSYLWPDDLDNLYDLIRTFPEHTVEFSACVRAVGTVPNRNTVVWECRRY